MIKKDEIATPTSCLNKAADDEPVFVLRAKDICAARVVEFWAQVATGIHELDRVDEAIDLAEKMREWRKKHVR